MITAGCGMQAAARYVGCAASTIRREAQRNTQFEQRIRNAFLTAELQPLDTIRKAAGTHWRAAAWLLERTNPHRYGRYHLRELKPDLLEAYSEQLAELLVDEIEDTQTARRIIRQMQRIGQRAAREAWLAERDLVLDMSDDIPDEIMDAP